MKNLNLKLGSFCTKSLRKRLIKILSRKNPMEKNLDMEKKKVHSV